MEITEMTLDDLEMMQDTLYSDFDNFWSYNVLKQELQKENLLEYNHTFKEYLKTKKIVVKQPQNQM